jgi:hypothetical protein
VFEGLFELTSVVPLAGFALMHLVTYGRTLFGTTEIGERHALPAPNMIAEALVIWLPFGFHLVYAPVVWRRRRREDTAQPEARAWVALHRFAGGVLALFLVDHFVRFRLPILRGDRYPAESVSALARELSTTTAGFPLLAAAYALGTLALSLHLGLGLARIVERHATPAVVRRARAACTAIALLTAICGTLTVLRLAAG